MGSPSPSRSQVRGSRPGAGLGPLLESSSFGFHPLRLTPAAHHSCEDRAVRSWCNSFSVASGGYSNGCYPLSRVPSGASEQGPWCSPLLRGPSPPEGGSTQGQAHFSFGCLPGLHWGSAATEWKVLWYEVEGDTLAFRNFNQLPVGFWYTVHWIWLCWASVLLSFCQHDTS